MPTYEYACKSCGEHLEVVQSFRDEPLTTCPNCEGELRKVFGAIGIAFKGSGFYKTDSRDSAGKAKAKSETKEPKEAKESKESKDSTVPAAKSGDSSGGSSSSGSSSSSSSGKGESKAAASS